MRPPSRRGFGEIGAWHALALYVVIAVVATWPLARGLSRNVAGDLGDPVFTMWVLAWDSQHLLAFARGDFSQASSFFDANIFHPAPLTLAYSEHFLPQAIQALPIYAATHNPILGYNLLFLSTFILSGLGGYLFARALTGDARAGVIGGLLFAFAPYRFPQTPHLQVLSSQWMAFALYGFCRYFASMADAATRGGRWRPLLGAAAALIVLNLSCGYYLMYFAPIVATYVFWEIWRRDAWRNVAMWRRLAGAGVLVVGFTVPLALPYLAVQQAMHLERGTAELVRYSADVYSYATANAQQPVWGTMLRAFPKAEGDLFPGVIAILLALIGVIFWSDASTRETPPIRFRAQHWLLAALAIFHVTAALFTLVQRRVTLDLGIVTIRMTNVTQLLLRAAIAGAILLALSPALRARCAAFMRSRGIFFVMLVAAMWLSLGPAPEALGRPLNFVGPYRLLYDYVPGYDGLRVPARFGMIVAFMFSILGGFGAAVITRWRWGPHTLALLAVLFLCEGLALPFTVNGVSSLPDYTTPEARVYPPSRAPAVYGAVPRERGVILAELPLGQQDYDLRAMFYSIGHRARLLNGYSGFFPPHYGQLALALSDVPHHPEPAWDALQKSGATHVIVHERAWLDDQGPHTSAALVQLGAREIFRDGADVLLKLP
jgi:hypothetical protein